MSKTGDSLEVHFGATIPPTIAVKLYMLRFSPFPYRCIIQPLPSVVEEVLEKPPLLLNPENLEGFLVIGFHLHHPPLAVLLLLVLRHWLL